MRPLPPKGYEARLLTSHRVARDPAQCVIASQQLLYGLEVGGGGGVLSLSALLAVASWAAS